RARGAGVGGGARPARAPRSRARARARGGRLGARPDRRPQHGGAAPRTHRSVGGPLPGARLRAKRIGGGAERRASVPRGAPEPSGCGRTPPGGGLSPETTRHDTFAALRVPTIRRFVFGRFGWVVGSQMLG